MCRILDSIDQGELVHRILHFLLASSPPPEEQMDMSASRRKSINVLAALASEAAQPSPSLFNLRDLVLLGLQSSNRQTVLATLRLLNVVLQRHHPFSRALIHTVPGQPAQQRTVGAFNAELEQLLTLGTSIFDDASLNESFEDYVADATWTLESRLCLPVSAADEAEGAIPLPLQLQQDDPIVQGLLSCVETFFTNSVIVNLALTGVLMSLASSHLFSLDGWVLVDPANYDEPEESSDELDPIHRAYQSPTWPATAKPTLTAALQRLVDQVRQWQQDLPDFDVLVAARRDLLHLGERPQTPGSSREPSEPVPTTLDRSRPSYPGSPDASVPASRGRSPNPISSQAVASLRGESESSRPTESRGSSTSRAATAETLRQRLATPFSPPKASNSESADPENVPATLGHVLTNVVILYEFLLELSAVVQARGSFFEEAGYV
jgi:hypothetical protein